MKLERGFSVERVRRVFSLRKIQSYVEVQCEEEGEEGEVVLSLAEAESTSM